MKETAMLDEADFIARYDKEDALGVVAKLPEQLQYDYPETSGLPKREEVTCIVLAGMGGSAQPGEFIKTWLGDRLPVPFVIVRDYALPAFVGKNTLVVVSSYSGNTEETIAALREAEKRGAHIVVSAAGGKLMEVAREKGYPHFVLPGALQPRMAVLYAVRAVTTLIERLGLVNGALAELTESGWWLAGQMRWGADIVTRHNEAKQIAGELVGHPVVVYAGPVLGFAAMKWKIAFNENAKNIAFYNYFPELNHNEFIGWGNPARSGITVIELRSDLDHERVQKRFDVTNRLQSQAFAPIEVQAQGKTRLEQLVWTIALGEYTATYLAILNKVDPTPVELVEKFKKALG